MIPPTDKRDSGLVNVYTELFGGWRNQPIRVLEIGIFRGGSIWFWSDLFKHPETLIVGIDIRIPQTDFPANSRIHICDQNDPVALQKSLRNMARLT
jgi:cephalosporin hydroxylase